MANALSAFAISFGALEGFQRISFHNCLIHIVNSSFPSRCHLSEYFMMLVIYYSARRITRQSVLRIVRRTTTNVKWWLLVVRISKTLPSSMLGHVVRRILKDKIRSAIIANED